MAPTRYRLVVRAELGARYASAFEGMTIFAHDGITEITGETIDPAHLHGLLKGTPASDAPWAASPARPSSHTTSRCGRRPAQRSFERTVARHEINLSSEIVNTAAVDPPRLRVRSDHFYIEGERHEPESSCR